MKIKEKIIKTMKIKEKIIKTTETKENIYIQAIAKAVHNFNYCKLLLEHSVDKTEEEIKEIVSSEIDKTLKYLFDFIPEEYEE